MPSSHLILCRPLFLLPPIPPCIRVFSNESTLRVRWPKYWNFSFSIIPSKEIPWLISFRMNWLDLLAHGSSLFTLHVSIPNTHSATLVTHLKCALPGSLKKVLLYSTSVKASEKIFRLYKLILTS